MKKKLILWFGGVGLLILFSAFAIFSLSKNSWAQIATPIVVAEKSVVPPQSDEGVIKLREDAVAKTSETISQIWNYQLAIIDERAITTGKVISAILLLSIGIWLSKAISNFVGRRIFPKLNLSGGGLAAIQSILFYLLVVFFALFALRLANVPLTVFTVIGGALAIGVGFGSQNIMNNFISGLIILVEQHVRVGDLVEVDDLQGMVKHIGPRSTIIRTINHTDIVVPNSQFLDKHVVNWTLSDNITRFKVDVGISYSSSIELAKKLLIQAAEENLHVISNPAPDVLFQEFGSSTINLQLFGFVFINSTIGPNVVQSELRYRIWELFQANGIEVAVPQRDVRLEMVGPVEVKTS
ncbi:MAG: mechanosensitive ion channel [SAR324 cluster bacterium]|uniref:Mechanosensitive ion channel n=1 Tax=SAR324 cluster bacterium TaxID=2024889 RepID=A0A7X9IKQ9_9DELT|nr:mechanosensitive ion channel [SAR324 cluster bacterium]